MPALREASFQQAIDSLIGTSDLEIAMTDVVAALRRATGAARVEWWAPSGDALRLDAVDGNGRGRRIAFELGPAGTLVFAGNADDASSLVRRIAPLVRRRFAEEQLQRTAARLVRRNQALEDFAALVAHELKTPLSLALASEDPARPIEQALELVDTILTAVRSESGRGISGSADAVARALEAMGEVDAAVETQLPPELPIPPATLHLLLRNLIGNAVSAGARTIRVAARPGSESWALVVDDDGVGLSSGNGYATGSGIGLQLSRRMAERLGGVLELRPRAEGGTRATLTLDCAA